MYTHDTNKKKLHTCLFQMRSSKLSEQYSYIGIDQECLGIDWECLGMDWKCSGIDQEYLGIDRA